MKLKTKLDAKTIAALELPDDKNEETFWDGSLPNFGYKLRRGRGGRILRSWKASYRTADGTQRGPTMPADKLTPARAREWADKILAQAALGQDPQGQKSAARRQASLTVRAGIDSYLEARQSELRPTSYRITKLYLTDSYFRPLHTLPVNAVTRADVAVCIRAIIRKHSTATAAAARRALSAFFAWSIAEGLLGNNGNPVDGSHRPADPASRDHVPSDRELVAIWRACQDDDIGRITRLLILLGSRRQEVGGMRWSELNLDAGTWTLPAARSKNHREHSIVLPAAALDIIKSVPRTNRDHLFGDRADDGFTSWTRGKQEIDQRLTGTVKPWRLHDIRRAVATGMANSGTEPHHIEACLNHYSGHRRGPAGIYNRSAYQHAVQAALARWSDHVKALIEGREPVSNVMPLLRRGV